MGVFISLLAVLALGLVAYLGVMWDYRYVFGVIAPYLAAAVFIAGFVYRVLNWARSPVPFSIPTTAGQQKSLDWIKWSPLENPTNKAGTVGRMIFEVFLFRSLFRNTSVAIKEGPMGKRVTYSSAKWLWLFALIFHYSFLVIFLRHFRFFTEPVPFVFSFLETMDGLFQIGAPRLYQTDILILAALGFLFLRRIFDQKMRYLSLANDFFPLFLIGGVVGTGIWMRYIDKTDIAGVKVLTMSLVNFNPTVPENIAPIFFIHVFLVSVLLAYFPFSKLMHMGGVFLSPTRNLPNDSRIRHWENPWNPPKKYHTYEAYEDDFRENMVEVGLPVDKPLDATTEDTAAEKAAE